MIRNVNQITIFEINEEEIKTDKVLIVESHWNDSDMIVLNIEGKKYTVHALDLSKAISNATNVR